MQLSWSNTFDATLLNQLEIPPDGKNLQWPTLAEGITPH